MWCEKITELKATEQYKDTRFYFITPLVTSCNNSVTSVKDYNQSKTNIHGFTLRDLCEAIIKTCAVYDIPVLDMNKDSGIYYNSPEDDHASAYFGDGVHPNDAGHAKLAQSIYHALTTDILQDFINRR
jgi:lysophospholipase L1-like esterase